MQHFLSRFKHRSILAFVILFAVTLPFPLSFFPAPGGFFHAFFAKLNAWSASLIGLKAGSNLQVESDSTGFYIHLLHLLLLAMIAGLVWTKLSKKEDEARLKYFVHVSATYILAFFLLKYGFDKVFKAQFYLPEPNTLYTPMGFLSKDILFWSTVGSSYSYSVFSGIMEVIPAFLLFSRRTRLLGGLLASGVLLHVLVINFSFDISVKILSMYLVLLCMLVVAPYCKALSEIFLFRKNQFTRPEIENVNLHKTRRMRLLKAFVIVCLLFESLFLYVDQNQFNDDHAPRPQFHGAYELVANDAVTQRKTSTGKSAFFGDLTQIRRVFIHRRGYLVLQFRDDSMQDFQAAFQSNQLKVKTNAGFTAITIFQEPKTGKYNFIWNENAQKFTLITNQLALDKLPLLQKQFHWIAE